MSWVLIYVALTMPGLDASIIAQYETMEECFVDREIVISVVGRPLVGYQVVCIRKVNQND